MKSDLYPPKIPIQRPSRENLDTVITGTDSTEQRDDGNDAAVEVDDTDRFESGGDPTRSDDLTQANMDDL